VEITGRSAIVTGSAHGIGRTIAQRLAREGARLLVVDLDERGGRDAVDEIRASGAKASLLVADVTVEADVAQMVEHAVRELGGLDILVNNAGGYDQPVFPDAPNVHWSHTLDLNLRAVMLAIHEAAPVMEARGGGAVVNIASSAGLGLAPHAGPEYATAKAAVIRLTACLAPLAERGVRVNCVCPHTVGTAAVRRTITDMRAAGQPPPPPLRAELIEPEEIAEVVVQFISDDNLAGRVIVCWGGEPPRLLPIAAAW